MFPMTLMTSRLALRWPLLKKVDYFVSGDGSQLWILHQARCQRAQTPDGLCSCENPETFRLPP